MNDTFPGHMKSLKDIIDRQSDVKVAEAIQNIYDRIMNRGSIRMEDFKAVNIILGRKKV
jgi:hypothetical protein